VFVIAILSVAAIIALDIGSTETDAIKVYENKYVFSIETAPDNNTVNMIYCHMDLELTNVWRETIHPEGDDFHLEWRDGTEVGSDGLSRTIGIRSELQPGEKDYITLIYLVSNKSSPPRRIVYNDGEHQYSESLRRWHRESEITPTNPIALSIAVAGTAFAVWVWDYERQKK
jgi:hypothetical protein